MYDTCTVKEKILIGNKFLNKNYKKEIQRQIELKNKNRKCTEETGYVISVMDDMKIISNSISTDSKGVVFDVEYTVKCIIPKINNKYIGRICMLKENLIFVDVAGILNVLVSSSKMPGWTYKDESFTKKDKIIRKGDEIEVTLTIVKYENMNFTCVGKLE